MAPTRDANQTWSIEPPIPQSAGTVVVYGGAFDPPHMGHIEPAIAARDAIDADWMVYVPAATPPLRDAGPIASAADRLEMLRLALAGHAGASVCDVELKRGGVSYTLDTLRALRDWLPGSMRLRLLIGADQAAQFHRWREPAQIIKLAEPVVVVRGEGDSADELIQRMRDSWPADEAGRWRSRIVRAPLVEASSTMAREAIARDDEAVLSRLLAPAVLDYIRERGLYR